MYDLDKISQDIDITVKRCGSWRAAVKATGINKASLENYFAKTTKEPREPNIRKLANTMRKDVSYYYKGTVDNGEMKGGLPASDYATARDLLKLHERIDKLAEEIGRIKDRLLDTSRTGDYHNLDPTRPFTRN